MTDIEQQSRRVTSGYCPSCKDTSGVWTDEKHCECISCGGTVYDDYDTFVNIGKEMGERFAALTGDGSD